MSAMPPVQELLDLLAAKGNDAYFGEQVSILEHSLQCAYFAEQSKASTAIITAALLHDIGHIVHGLPEDIADHGEDGRHEEVAARYLSRWFDPDVTEAVRLHVAAKRYLCSTDPNYTAQLSQASIDSLRVQGGPMSAAEVAAFEALPTAMHAVELRRWDEQAKIQNFVVPGLQHYLPVIKSAAKV